MLIIFCWGKKTFLLRIEFSSANKPFNTNDVASDSLRKEMLIKMNGVLLLPVWRTPQLSQPVTWNHQLCVAMWANKSFPYPWGEEEILQKEQGIRSCVCSFVCLTLAIPHKAPSFSRSVDHLNPIVNLLAPFETFSGSNFSQCTGRVLVGDRSSWSIASIYPSGINRPDANEESIGVGDGHCSF